MTCEQAAVKARACATFCTRPWREGHFWPNRASHAAWECNFWKYHFHAVWEAKKTCRFSIKICAKVDFWNTSRARTSFLLTRHREQHVENHDFMTSFLTFSLETCEKNGKSRIFVQNSKLMTKWKCCSHQWWEYQKCLPRVTATNVTICNVIVSLQWEAHFCNFCNTSRARSEVAGTTSSTTIYIYIYILILVFNNNNNNNNNNKNNFFPNILGLG